MICAVRRDTGHRGGNVNSDVEHDPVRKPDSLRDRAQNIVFINAQECLLSGVKQTWLEKVHDVA